MYQTQWLEPDFDHYNDFQKHANKRKNKKRVKIGMELNDFYPMTDNQKYAFEEYHGGQHLVLHGVAGTGKTFITLYLALQEYYSKRTNIKNITIVRSIVPSRDIGFLPGNPTEKAKAYESPYYSIFSELFDRGDAYDILKNKHIVNFISTSYIRGTTLNDTIIVVDEYQNMSDQELNSIITRVGRNSRIIFCGDFRQTDLPLKQSGFQNFMKILSLMSCVSIIEFGINDIVRSGFVKDYIVAREKLF